MKIKKLGVAFTPLLLMVSMLMISDTAHATTYIDLSTTDSSKIVSKYYKLDDFAKLSKSYVDWPLRSSGCASSGVTSYKTLPWLADTSGVDLSYGIDGNYLSQSGDCSNRYKDGGSSDRGWVYTSALSSWATATGSLSGWAAPSSSMPASVTLTDGRVKGVKRIWGASSPDKTDKSVSMFKTNGYSTYSPSTYYLYGSGVTLFRHVFTVTSTQYDKITNEGATLKLHIGADDWYVAYLNGTRVSYSTSSSDVNTVSIGSGTLKEGTNVFAVQAMDKAYWKALNDYPTDTAGLAYSLYLAVPDAVAPPPPPPDPDPDPGLCVINFNVADLDADGAVTLPSAANIERWVDSTSNNPSGKYVFSESPDASWLNSSGFGGVLILKTNSENTTGAIRETTVTMSSSTDPSCKDSVVVRQESTALPPPPPPPPPPPVVSVDVIVPEAYEKGKVQTLGATLPIVHKLTITNCVAKSYSMTVSGYRNAGDKYSFATPLQFKAPDAENKCEITYSTAISTDYLNNTDLNALPALTYTTTYEGVSSPPKTLAVFEAPFARFFGSDVLVCNDTPKKFIYDNRVPLSGGNPLRGSFSQYASFFKSTNAPFGATPFLGLASLTRSPLGAYSSGERLSSTWTPLSGCGNMPEAEDFSGVTTDTVAASDFDVSKTYWNDGDIQITGDITRNSSFDFTNVSTYPVVVIRAAGNIYINPAVKHIEAVLIADGGSVYTCATSSADIKPNSLYDDDCATPLKIRGAVMATNGIYLQRAKGTRYFAPVTSPGWKETSDDKFTAAEIIEFPDYLNFVRSFDLKSRDVGSFESYKSVPPRL